MIEDDILKILWSESTIKLADSLLVDLAIDGDDAGAILERCQQKFALDLKNFNFADYFRSEPCLKSVIFYWRKCRYKDEHLATNKHPMSVQMLMEACKNGSW